jgi:hypothetical protein
MLVGASSLKAPKKRLKRFSPITSRVSRIKSSGKFIILGTKLKKIWEKPLSLQLIYDLLRQTDK